MGKGTMKSAQGRLPFRNVSSCISSWFMVFTHDAAERQKCYIQQAIHKPQRVTVHLFISQMEVLNGYLKVLPMLKNSPKAVATTKKGNVPFGDADLVSILLLLSQSCSRISTASCTLQCQNRSAHCSWTWRTSST